MKLAFLVSFPFAALLAACGGGGDGSPATSAVTPSISVAPPATGNSGISAPDARMRIMAAAQTASAPAPDATTELLPVTSAGTIVLNEVQHFIGFVRTPGGKYFGLSDASGTHLVDPARVKLVCFNSFETGWAVDGRTSRACSPIDETGYAPLPINATCNRALGAWSAILDDGTVLWFDFESERAWKIEGLPVVRHATANDPLRGLIEYGAGGRQQPYATAASDGNGGANLTINFGSNCQGGFGLDNKLTNLMPAIDTYFKYVWNSPKASASGGHGWGVVQVGDRAPSVREAYAEYDAATGSYSVTFKGLACADRGNITVYKGVGPTDAVVWDPGVDAKGDTGFGIGWFAIQRDPTELQLWVAKDPVSFDREKYQIVWSLPGCTG